MKYIAIIMAAFLLSSGGVDLPQQHSLEEYDIVQPGENDSIQPGEYDSIEYTNPVLAYYETTLDGLESRASNIVRGVVSNDARNVLHYFPGIDPIPLYSAITFEVLEVIQGDGDVKAGDIMTILEPYYIIDRILVTRGNYLPSTPHQEYIFFLGNRVPDTLEEGYGPQGYEGAHFVIHCERGRYLVPNGEVPNIKAYSNKELSLGEQDTELYRSLYQEVVDAYLN
ncbi:MAG: hypothetical protein AAGU12_09065 [Clostridiales bacterium]